MAGSKDFDLVIKNIKVVRPSATIVDDVDIAIKNGKFAKIAPNISVGKAKNQFDGKGRMAFPGLVYPHMHNRVIRLLKAWN